jgi:DNA processing protein
MTHNLQNEEFHLLALQSIEGLGAIKSNILLQHYKSAEAIFKLTMQDLLAIGNGISKSIIEQIIDKSSFAKAENEYKFCQKNQIDIISSINPLYPARLKHLADKPHIIFKKGEIFPLVKKSLAIVGTRKSTDYGHRFLENLFEELKAVKDLSIVSGLALGVDQKAHSLSVKHKIPTIGVMGIALDKIYPTQNYNLAQSMLKEGGGWMTETSSQDKLVQGLFPKRNRLIAGMCDAILVVETDLKGGSVITAHLANDYERDIFALPGRTTDAQSRGCNDLIQKNIATMVNSPTDIIEFMSWNTKTNKNVPKAMEIDFEGTANQKKVIESIRKSPRIEFEKLLIETNLEHGPLVEILLGLELDEMINTLPGNKYELI